jgi:hypothetical protein
MDIREVLDTPLPDGMRTYVPPTAAESRAQWVEWLAAYGLGRFYDAFLSSAQGATSLCVNCGRRITLDIVEGGGVPDWSADGDYGCDESPDTNDDGVGSHIAEGTADA